MRLDILDISKAKLTQFNKKGIETVEDLIEFVPQKYNDFRVPKKCSEVIGGELVAMIGVIRKVSEGKSSSGRDMVTFQCEDEENHTFYVRYMNSLFMSKMLQYGDKVAFCGNVSVEMRGSNKIVTMFNPIRYSKEPSKLLRIVPIYKKIQGMSSDYFENALQQALTVADKTETLETDVLQKYELVTTADKINYIHSPKNADEIKKARKRLIFDDLFFFNFLLKERSLIKGNLNLKTITNPSLFNDYAKQLPFDLTADQKRVIKELYQKGKRGERINTLLQGDVGYGKTEVSKALTLFFVGSGSSVIVIAPTVILAKQHYNDFSSSFKNLPINIAFLSSETKKSEAKKIKKEIKEGKIDVLIGTHSCLSEDVSFDNLGLFVVDEEHKFGVKQRDLINQRLKNGVHVLSMSATPIPRSFAMAMYSDDIMIEEIKTAPAFKKEIITKVIHTDKDMVDLINTEIQKGHQAYVVCPLIEDSESETMEKVESVESVYGELKEYYNKKGIHVGMINGKMIDEEIDAVINRFVKKELSILISTTIVEVGVNVLNSTVMVIKNAERFGLSQLHQLRGRVGRGKEQGYCLLQTPYEDVERLQVLEGTNDGFIIAEKDLELRGAGDFIGTTQTGDNKFVSLVMKYPKFNNTIRGEINEIFKDNTRYNFYKEKLQKKLLEYSN